MSNYQLHVISTGQQPIETLVEKVRRIHPYIDLLHLREKSWTAKEFVKAIDHLVRAGLPLRKLIINDRVDVAFVTGVKGVQLAHHSINITFVKRYFPSLKIGCSIHSLEEALIAEKSGADYVLYGHIFPTASKQGIPPKGVANLKKVTKSVSIPVIAIGGINPKNKEEVLNAGAKGIAVLSGILLADDPLEAVQKYRNI